MENYLLLFKSLTSAQRAERLLRQKGIKTKITRVPGEIPTNGCTYCIKILPVDLSNALKTLNRYESSPTKIFAWYGSGRYSSYNDGIY